MTISLTIPTQVKTEQYCGWKPAGIAAARRRQLSVNGSLAQSCVGTGMGQTNRQTDRQMDGM